MADAEESCGLGGREALAIDQGEDGLIGIAEAAHGGGQGSAYFVGDLAARPSRGFG